MDAENVVEEGVMDAKNGTSECGEDNNVSSL